MAKCEKQAGSFAGGGATKGVVRRLARAARLCRVQGQEAERLDLRAERSVHVPVLQVPDAHVLVLCVYGGPAAGQRLRAVALVPARRGSALLDGLEASLALALYCACTVPRTRTVRVLYLSKNDEE